VRIDKEKHLQKILEFYMGKNTPDRQEFIIDNLRIEMDIVESIPEKEDAEV
jgi:topoisomerase-4 subunit B